MCVNRVNAAINAQRNYRVNYFNAINAQQCYLNKIINFAQVNKRGKICFSSIIFLVEHGPYILHAKPTSGSPLRPEMESQKIGKEIMDEQFKFKTE